MKRRTLTQKLGTFSLAGLMLLALMPVTGCKVTASQVQADGNVLYQALINVAAVESVTNPAAAAALTTAAKDLLAVTSNWQTGGAVAIFNSAATAVEIALAAIPPTAVVAPFIPIAIAAIDALIANIPGATPPQPATLATARSNALVDYRAQAEGKIHHRMLRSPKGDLVAAWNAAVKANPGVGIVAVH